MIIFTDYILVNEICKKANKSGSWLHMTQKENIEYMGGTSVVNISHIDRKYKEEIDKCTKLNKYCTFAYFAEQLGFCKTYLNTRERQTKKEYESINVGGLRLIKLPDIFIENIQKGLSPHKLKRADKEEDYKTVIKINDLRIGFY